MGKTFKRRHDAPTKKHSSGTKHKTRRHFSPQVLRGSFGTTRPSRPSS